MSVLITGATGLIGGRICELLMEEGLNVKYLTTNKSKILHKKYYQGYYWNPISEEIDSGAFEDVVVIIHLAGASVSKPWTKSYKKEIVESRVKSSGLLFKFLSENKNEVRQIISSSGISIYPSSFDQLYDESTKEKSTSFLGEVTQKWENAVDTFKEIGLRTSFVRTGIVLSNSGGALEQISKPIKLGVGAVIGTGAQWQSWIHLDDIAGIFIHILKNELEGIYNGVAPGPVTNKKMTGDIAAKLKKPLWLPKIPSRFMKILLGERSDLVLESQLVSAEKIRQTGYRFRYVNLESALDDLI